MKFRLFSSIFSLIFLLEPISCRVLKPDSRSKTHQNLQKREDGQSEASVSLFPSSPYVSWSSSPTISGAAALSSPSTLPTTANSGYNDSSTAQSLYLSSDLASLSSYNTLFASDFYGSLSVSSVSSAVSGDIFESITQITRSTFSTTVSSNDPSLSFSSSSSSPTSGASDHSLQLSTDVSESASQAESSTLTTIVLTNDPFVSISSSILASSGVSTVSNSTASENSTSITLSALSDQSSSSTFPTPPPVSGVTTSTSSTSEAPLLLLSNQPGTTNHPTLTITNTPPGFSTKATTNSLWTQNFMTKTTGPDGKETTIPVVRCKSCDPEGGEKIWIFMWNLVSLPNVEIKLPKFPIPTIKFPTCFNIIIINTCPPETPDDDPSETAGLPPLNEIPKTTTKPTNVVPGVTQVTAPTTAPTAVPTNLMTTSLTTCSASLVTDCLVSTTCSESLSLTTVAPSITSTVTQTQNCSTITTCSVTRSGCDLTPSTSSTASVTVFPACSMDMSINWEMTLFPSTPDPPFTTPSSFMTSTQTSTTSSTTLVTASASFQFSAPGLASALGSLAAEKSSSAAAVAAGAEKSNVAASPTPPAASTTATPVRSPAYPSCGPVEENGYACIDEGY
ncbi:hypothetical protein BT63DRAFT_476118 [Microthyrium microscopicum]|uniref:CBM1 domain-containing protein n=1 Tax=Microthyrium microscopicum TaxID=703497 RepID=A0A6A6URD7_9PEZI|nr:hypothetical protein BT63DRAFT_476118 [Microthyrium microscopicum]